MKRSLITAPPAPVSRSYRGLFSGVVHLFEQARQASARSINSLITATYWEIGRRIVEHEQRGQRKAEYGEQVINRLAGDLTSRLGRGFSRRNLFQIRHFYLAYAQKVQTVSAQLASRTLPASGGRKVQTVSAQFGSSPKGLEGATPGPFPLSWSHYVGLLSVEDPEARSFYETEALRGGWSVRQLDRQLSTAFYERTMASRRPASATRAAGRPAANSPTPESEMKDPFVLEFLGLRDEYSEGALEEALIHHLESFLLELGNDFAFVARQKRLRIGDEWYRTDLVLFHRLLRCLVLVELKVGKFTHADAGQMNLYLNYAREHWTATGENPPVGLILCTRQDEAVAYYALGNLANKVMARRYRLVLPPEKQLVAAMKKGQQVLESRPQLPPPAK